MALLGSWGTKGVPGVCICLSMDTLGSIVSVLNDELQDHTRAVGLPRPQSHTSISGTLMRVHSAVTTGQAAHLLAEVK